MDRDTRALTGLRGIAALWVVAHHFCGGLDAMPGAHFVLKGYLAVDLFFVLSGFVIALNHGAAFASGEPSDLCGAFYRRRIARVYPLLLAVMLLTLSRRVLAGDPLPSALDLVGNLTMTQAWFARDGIVDSGWSLSVEAFAYLAFPWIAAFAFRRSPVLLVGALLAAWMGLWWMTTLDPARSFGELNPDGPLDVHDGGAYPLLRCLCGFAAGVCAYRLACLPRLRAILSVRGLPEALLASIILMAWRTERDVAIAALFVPLVCALAVPGHVASRLLRSPLAMRLGALSYAVYLTHMLVGPLVRDALVGRMPYALVLLACVLATLAASAVLHALVERPCHLKSARHAPPAAPSPATAW